MASILETAADAKHEEGDRITQSKIMYSAFLSYIQVKEYLPLLVQSGLLEYRKHNQTYKITEKGLQFIKAYNEIGITSTTPAIVTANNTI